MSVGQTDAVPEAVLSSLVRGELNTLHAGLLDSDFLQDSNEFRIQQTGCNRNLICTGSRGIGLEDDADLGNG
jgi:hypothetical protein